MWLRPYLFSWWVNMFYSSSLIMFQNANTNANYFASFSSSLLCHRSAPRRGFFYHGKCFLVGSTVPTIHNRYRFPLLVPQLSLLKRQKSRDNCCSLYLPTHLWCKVEKGSNSTPVEFVDITPQDFGYSQNGTDHMRISFLQLSYISERKH